MKKVLYLSYTGLLEPLGRSQILAYLSRLSDEYQFTIVSFEKPADYADKKAVSTLRKECDELGINWQAKIYHHRPRFLATLFDLFVLFYTTWLFSRKGAAQVVHCRSYIPAIAAWFVGKFTGTPFIFDMRALWPEEMLAAGRLQRGSVMHKALLWFEVRLLRDAAHVVSLTKVAVDYLREQDPCLAEQDFSVITTCVDLEKFRFEERADTRVKLGTLGTVLSGWYYLDWLMLSFQRQREIDPLASFKIITRDDRQELLSLAEKYDLPEGSLEVRASSPANIAANISDIRAGLLYFTPGVSKLGSAPTRMGEFLACGIPVIGNRGVGDMADLIEHYGVGVVIEDGDTSSIDQALVSLERMYHDQGLPKRCRHAAEDYFSADRGAEGYQLIYESLVGKPL